MNRAQKKFLKAFDKMFDVSAIDTKVYKAMILQNEGIIAGDLVSICPVCESLHTQTGECEEGVYP